MNKRVKSSVSMRAKELEAELSGEITNQTNKYSVDAGRDVTTDLTGWQQAAVKKTTRFAIKQGFRRHHPTRTLSSYAKRLANGVPRVSWERAFEEETKRTEIPQIFKKASDPMIACQLGLVTTALKNYEKSRAKLSDINAIGV